MPHIDAASPRAEAVATIGLVASTQVSSTLNPKP
jgi:hypothetical protein